MFLEIQIVCPNNASSSWLRQLNWSVQATKTLTQDSASLRRQMCRLFAAVGVGVMTVDIVTNQRSNLQQ